MTFSTRTNDGITELSGFTLANFAVVVRGIQCAGCRDKTNVVATITGTKSQIRCMETESLVELSQIMASRTTASEKRRRIERIVYYKRYARIIGIIV